MHVQNCRHPGIDTCHGEETLPGEAVAAAHVDVQHVEAPQVSLNPRQGIDTLRELLKFAPLACARQKGNVAAVLDASLIVVVDDGRDTALLVACGPHHEDLSAPLYHRPPPR